MFDKFSGPVLLLARVLLAVLFVVSGYGKVMHYADTAGYMASGGLPMVQLLLPLTILVELGGGLLIVFGLFTRPVALIVFLFLIPVTLTFHAGSDPEQQIHFMKNLAIMGGMLVLAVHGAGSWSLDARRK